MGEMKDLEIRFWSAVFLFAPLVLFYTNPVNAVAILLLLLGAFRIHRDKAH